jgi:DNA-binding transcriptional LysR family regulator
VSRQVQALEQQLGLTLFRREGRQVQLTDVGRLYQRELSEALGRIRSATLQALAYQSGVGTLRLATLPTFGSKWLLPSLHAFYSAHPGMLVHIHSRIEAIFRHQRNRRRHRRGQPRPAGADLPSPACRGTGGDPAARGRRGSQNWSPARISVKCC